MCIYHTLITSERNEGLGGTQLVTCEGDIYLTGCTVQNKVLSISQSGPARAGPSKLNKCFLSPATGQSFVTVGFSKDRRAATGRNVVWTIQTLAAPGLGRTWTLLGPLAYPSPTWSPVSGWALAGGDSDITDSNSASPSPCWACLSWSSIVEFAKRDLSSDSLQWLGRASVTRGRHRLCQWHRAMWLWMTRWQAAQRLATARATLSRAQAPYGTTG